MKGFTQEAILYADMLLTKYGGPDKAVEVVKAQAAAGADGWNRGVTDRAIELIRERALHWN